MNYEQKYKEALGWMQSLYGGLHGVTKEDAEHYFPELKESEDERIRKTLIENFKWFCGDYPETTKWGKDDNLLVKDIIAWLEKQGNLMKALQISNARIGELIEKNYYLKEQLEKQSEQKTTIEMKTPEESLGIDSDTYNKIVDECIYGEQKPIKKHNACEFCEDRYGCVSPCSMKLIEEEKPVDKIELKFKVGDTIRLKNGDGLEWTVEEVLNNGYCTIVCADRDDFIQLDDKWELVEQKPTWSEEDIELLDNTIKFIEDRVAATSPSLRTYSPTLTGKEIPFLKALKDRVQPKQEWSEEDESRTITICTYLQDYARLSGSESRTIRINEYCDWLKSLRPQSQWKPSDEHMDALRYVTNFDYGGYKATLVSLYEQLKKLKG